MSLRSLRIACLAFLACASLGLQAQAPPASIKESAPPPVKLTQPMAQLLSMGAAPHNYVLPAVTGEPYSLTETRTSVRKQAAGPPATTVFVEHLTRDSQGRTRTDLGRIEDGEFKSISVSLMDPVGHFTATLFAGQKLALVTHFPAAAPMTPEQKAAADARKAAQDEARKSAPKNPNEEDLPAETIEGITVPGKRLHLVMQGAAVTEDTWFSTELHLQMKSETEDPRAGHFSSIISELNRAEPSPSLFQIPNDYTVQSHD